VRWIYLSPHFDDVALSCGGLVWEQAREGPARRGSAVEVWTVCAGGPEAGADLSAFAQELHARWETGPEAVLVRQAEDEQAIRLLGAALRSWDLPDCIYRRLPGGDWLVNNNDDLWQPLPAGEQGVVDRLADWIVLGIGQGSSRTDTRLVSPLTLGNHVDHSLVRAAAERAAARSGVALWYYPDYPYAANPETSWAGKTGAGWQQACQAVSRAALAGWQEAVARYESQISTFWSSREDLDASIEAYWQSGGGTCLWKPG
jgi:LmbE family N-acetylglucosaminyl deacetylase